VNDLEQLLEIIGGAEVAEGRAEVTQAPVKLLDVLAVVVDMAGRHGSSGWA
jgi:hypothetical protein